MNKSVFLICSIFLHLFLIVTCRRTVTSPGVCLSDADCPSANTFCANGNGATYRCENRLPINAICRFSSSRQCKSGLYCSYSISSGVSLCTPQESYRTYCNWFELDSCLGKNTYCSKNIDICLFASTTVGTECRGQEMCDGSKGLYCDFKAGVCKKKKPAGKSCLLFDENFKYNEEIDCQTYCIPRTSNEGVCASWAKLGGRCKDDRQCAGKQNENLAIRPRCNKGRCTPENQIIKGLGAPCNRNFDKCDQTRGLSCRWNAARSNNVCQHFSTLNEFCKPGSPLSRCFFSPNGEPLECRKQQNYKSDITDFSSGLFFPKCLRQRQILPRGALCNQEEYGVCTTGTKCMPVPGVSYVKPQGEISGTQPAYCVNIVNRVGGICFDKFTTACGSGLTCNFGYCSQGGASFNNGNSFITHYGPNVTCDGKKPCSPGLVCVSKGSRKVCDLPTVTVKGGQPCYPTAQFYRRCEFGFKCSRNSKGYGVKTCYRA